MHGIIIKNMGPWKSDMVVGVKSRWQPHRMLPRNFFMYKLHYQCCIPTQANKECYCLVMLYPHGQWGRGSTQLDCEPGNQPWEFLWRTHTEQFDDDNVVEHDRYSGGSVMLWGGISTTGRTDLYLIQNGTLNRVQYHDKIVDPYVWSYAGPVSPISFLWLITRPHRARVVHQYLEEQVIDKMDWHVCYSDLNPIEHLWDILQTTLSARDDQPMREILLL